MNIHRIRNMGIPKAAPATESKPTLPSSSMGMGKIQGAGDFSSALNAALETTSDSSIEKLKALESGEKKDDVGLREATREFESYFVNMLLKQVRKTLNDGGLTEKSEARKNFESMLDQEYAKLLSEGEGIGLGKAMYEAMKKTYF